jgi:hypothetical protein
VDDISVSLAATTIALTDGRRAVTASVTNRGTSPERVVLGVYEVPQHGPGAGVGTGPRATVERPLRELGPGATEQYVLEVETADATPGTHQLKVIAYPASRAPEEYSDRGQTLRVDVPAAPAPSPTPSRWWMWALAAVALVVVVVVVVVLLTRSGGGEAGVGSCTAAEVQVSTGVGDAGAGQLHVPLVVTNTGVAPCTLGGFPTVVSLDGAGRQVAQAEPEAIGTPADIELAPGETASALVRATTVPSDVACPPDSVALAVTLPGDTEVIEVAVTLPACPGLSVRAFVPGEAGL